VLFGHPNNQGGGGGGGNGNSGPIGIDHGDPNASNQLLIDIKFLALQIAVSTQENWTDVHANPRYHRIAPVLVDPSNPCGGGLEIGILEPDPPTVDDCDELKKLFTIDTAGTKLVPNIKPQIQWLMGKVDEKKEYGVEIKRAINLNGDMIYTPTQIQSNSNFSLSFNQGNFYMGWMHSHPINGYGMFSFQDLKFLIDGYNLTSEQNKAELFTIIVCRDKIDTTKTNTYALKVDDIAKLSTKISTIWNNSDYNGLNDDVRLTKIHEKQSGDYHYYEDDIEFSFLMQFPNSGISLYKADEQLNNWTNLELQEEVGFSPPLSVKRIPCN
jgi:hypothetical protein